MSEDLSTENKISRVDDGHKHKHDHIEQHLHTCTHIYLSTHVQEAQQKHKRSLLSAVPWAVCNDVSLGRQTQNYNHWKTLSMAACQSLKKQNVYGLSQTCIFLHFMKTFTMKQKVQPYRQRPVTKNVFLTDWWFLLTQLLLWTSNQLHSNWVEWKNWTTSSQSRITVTKKLYQQ